MMNSLKTRLLGGEEVSLSNSNKDIIEVRFATERFINRFQLRVNGRLVKSTKTIDPIEYKLMELNAYE